MMHILVTATGLSSLKEASELLSGLVKSINSQATTLSGLINSTVTWGFKKLLKEDNTTVIELDWSYHGTPWH